MYQLGDGVHRWFSAPATAGAPAWGVASMTLDTNGNLSTTGAVVGGSSRELKKDIVDLMLDEALETLAQLKPVKYYYKADSTDQHLGFIAEDVPDLVATKDRKGLSSMDIVALLTKVVQQQQDQLLAQEKVINDQGSQYVELEAKVARLESALEKLETLTAAR